MPFFISYDSLFSGLNPIAIHSSRQKFYFVSYSIYFIYSSHSKLMVLMDICAFSRKLGIALEVAYSDALLLLFDFKQPNSLNVKGVRDTKIFKIPKKILHL